MKKVLIVFKKHQIDVISSYRGLLLLNLERNDYRILRNSDRNFHMYSPMHHFSAQSSSPSDYVSKSLMLLS